MPPKLNRSRGRQVEAGYAVATDRHRDLAALLVLPTWCVSKGFQDLNAQPSLPAGFLDTIDALDE